MLGMDSTTVNNAKLCICAGNNTSASTIDFSYAGQVTTGTVGATTAGGCQARIALFHTACQFAFSPRPAAVLRP
jgi:hypothetical protein